MLILFRYIYKGKCSRSDPSSYRPISLTSVACKLLEFILKKYLSLHLFKNDLLTGQQHGFLSKKSTETQLLQCVNDWTKSLDCKNAVDVFYLDISKAFDTVSHPKLIRKIEKYGITGKFLNWIKNFLLSRFQQVRVDGTLSDNISVISGVPQGSVLGPLLFLIYINDLARVIRCSSVKMFADDTKIYFKCVDDVDHANLCSDIEAALDWMCRNQLSVASEKCTLLHLGNRFLNPHRSYSFNGNEIPSISLMKDLGINRR